MKYITTDKHPDLKKELKFETDEDCYRVINRVYDIDISLQNNLIEELQEPEFTKDDMIEFAFWALSEQDNYEKETIKLDDWLNQRNK